MQYSNTWTTDTSNDCKSNAMGIMIIIYIKTEFYWKVWENKWVFNCDLNEEYVCVWQIIIIIIIIIIIMNTYSA